MQNVLAGKGYAASVAIEDDFLDRYTGKVYARLISPGRVFRVEPRNLKTQRNVDNLFPG